VRRLLLPLAAALAVFGLGPSAVADTVVTDYQDPLQALPSVSRPATESCTVTAMHHVFANSYGQPYVGTLTPPSRCRGDWTKVVLDWTASSAGRQYDRLAGIWIGGAEVARTSTPEPDPTGITWHFDKDITEFSPLLHQEQPFVVDLGNVVDDTYTGPYDVTVTITYFKTDRHHAKPHQADKVIPLAADHNAPGWQALSDGQTYAAQVTVPRNTAKLTAELYARGGGCEEFWWSNVPTSVSQGNPDAGLCGGGTYREVAIAIDGRPAGAVMPYPTIYTGGVAPMLWRPISAIDAIVTLPYTIDLSPFIGTLTDGKAHAVTLTPPTGIVDAWTLGGNLFATTDPHAKRVTGELRTTDVPAAQVHTDLTGTGIDVTAKTTVHRAWHTEGVLRTSQGRVAVRSSGEWTFANTTSLADAAARQQTTHQVDGAYTSNGRTDRFGFALDADSTTDYTDANNYRIDATVHMGRTLRTEIKHGKVIAETDDQVDTSGGFGRTNGELTYADGESTQRWRGLDDTGRCLDRTLVTAHGWVTADHTGRGRCGATRS
jgi:hypothetical protein